jgi:hypothetical protein
VSARILPGDQHCQLERLGEADPANLLRRRLRHEQVLVLVALGGRANCRVGKVRRAYSKIVKRGRVISQKPGFGAVLPKGAKVTLVVSKGRRR